LEPSKMDLPIFVKNKQLEQMLAKKFNQVLEMQEFRAATYRDYN